MVSSGYCYDVDTWLTFSIRMSFSTYNFQLFLFVIEKKKF
jgi:hypothetical protein